MNDTIPVSADTITEEQQQSTWEDPNELEEITLLTELSADIDEFSNSTTSNSTEATAAEWHARHGIIRYDQQLGSTGHGNWPAGGQQTGNAGSIPRGNIPRRGPSLTGCPPGQGRPTPAEKCQPCPYGRFSPGDLVTSSCW